MGRPGIWGRPCTPDQLRTKASDCLTAAFGSEASGGILEAAFAVDRFAHADFVRLMTSLSRSQNKRV